MNPEIEQSTLDKVKDSDRVYYTFSKSTGYGDGTYKTYFKGGVEEGKYKLSEKDDKKLIYLETEDLEFNLTGSKAFGNTKLTIIILNTQMNKLVRSIQPRITFLFR